MCHRKVEKGEGGGSRVTLKLRNLPCEGVVLKSILLTLGRFLFAVCVSLCDNRLSLVRETYNRSVR